MSRVVEFYDLCYFIYVPGAILEINIEVGEWRGETRMISISLILHHHYVNVLSSSCCQRQ